MAKDRKLNTQSFSPEIDENSINMFYHNERIDAISDFANEVAHDFNNILMRIVGFTELSLELDNDIENIKSNLEHIRRTSSEASTLTHQLFQISKNQYANKIHFRLSELIKNIMDSDLRKENNDKILTLDLDESDSPIYADPDNIKDMIIYIYQFLHSISSQQSKTIIATETLNDNLKHHFLNYYHNKYSDFFMLSIMNNDCTFISDQIEHIFEPFSSIDRYSLRLPITYRLAKSNDSFIRCSHRKEKEIRFEIVFALE